MQAPGLTVRLGNGLHTHLLSAVSSLQSFASNIVREGGKTTTTFTIVIVEPDKCAQKHISSRRALRSKERSDKYFARRIAQGGCESAPTGSQPTKKTTYRDVASNSQPKCEILDFEAISGSKVAESAGQEVLSEDSCNSGGGSPSDGESAGIGRDAAVAHSSDPEDDCDGVASQQQVNSDQIEAPNVVEQVAIVVGATQTDSNSNNRGNSTVIVQIPAVQTAVDSSSRPAPALIKQLKRDSVVASSAPPLQLVPVQELKQVDAPKPQGEVWTRVGRDGRPMRDFSHLTVPRRQLHPTVVCLEPRRTLNLPDGASSSVGIAKRRNQSGLLSDVDDNTHCAHIDGYFVVSGRSEFGHLAVPNALFPRLAKVRASFARDHSHSMCRANLAALCHLYGPCPHPY